MKHAIIITISCVLCASCRPSASRRALDRVRSQHDPFTTTLEQGYNSYVRCAVLPDGTELGVIQLRDGSSCRYWFRSHHLENDLGGTWFSMSDGTERFMAGYFCCEVQLPEVQLASLDELRDFISRHDGERP